MAIKILSKLQFEGMLNLHNIYDENIKDFKHITFISILNTDIIGDNIGHFKKEHENVLILKFDDIEEDLQTEDGIIKAFSYEDGDKVLEFINREQNKENIENGRFFVHCSAGVSRSGAIGTFISDYFKHDYTQFKRNNPYIKPNPTVLRILKEKTYYNDYL